MNRPYALTLCSALLLAYISPALTAQVRFEQRMLKAQHLTTPGDAFVAFDADGDGHMDLLAARDGWPASASDSLRLYRNDGAGNLSDVTTTHLPVGGSWVRRVNASDFDGDGDVDVLLLQTPYTPSTFWSYQFVLLTNDGQGHFSNVTASSGLSGSAYVCFSVGDIDGDGDLDITAGLGGNGPFPGGEHVFVNDGTAQFTEESAQRLPANASTAQRSAVVLADLDGDSDLDLIFTEWPNPSPVSSVYENDGFGAYVVATTIQLPATSPGVPEYAADLDADGDLDLLVSSSTSGLLTNDGNGVFTFDPGMPATSWGPQRPTIIDVDADNDLDVLHGSQLLIQDSSGTFVDESTARGLLHATGSGSCAFDWDGDADLDLILGDGVRYVNDGQWNFHATWVPRAPASLYAHIAGAAVADFDGNGEIDVIAGHATMMQYGGRLLDTTSTSDPQSNLRSWVDVVVGDFDGDGDIDAAGCTRGGGGSNGGSWPALALNDGTGVFTSAPFPSPTNYDAVRRVECADFDNDGDLDLIYCGIAAFGQISEPTRLYLNNGSAVFTEVTTSNLPSPQTPSEAIAHGDIDGDGDIDLVLARIGSNLVYLNDGTATFVDASATALPFTANASNSVKLVDVDGDGDLDLFVGNDGQDLLLQNDGTGHFVDVTASHLPAGLEWTRDAQFVDIDSDGDLDALLSTWAQVTAQGQFVLENDGAGHFVDVTTQSLFPTSNPTVSMVLVDLDSDGDADLIRLENSWVEPHVTGSGGPGTPPPVVRRVTVLTNMTAQLEAPTMPQLGHPLTIHAFTRGRGVTGSDLALLGVSAAPAQVHAPIGGVLGIDLDQLVFLSAFPVPRATGEGSITIAVPNLPGLANVDLYLQAIVLGGTQLPHLTNRLHERVIQ